MLSLAKFKLSLKSAALLKAAGVVEVDELDDVVDDEGDVAEEEEEAC